MELLQQMSLKLNKKVKRQETKKGYSLIGIPNSFLEIADLRNSDYAELTATPDGIRIRKAGD